MHYQACQQGEGHRGAGGGCTVFLSHHLPLVLLAGLPSDPAFHPDLHPRGCGETHHPDS